MGNLMHIKKGRVKPSILWTTLSTTLWARRELNTGPLAPKARIIPLDQQTTINLIDISIAEVGQMICMGTSV